MKQLTNAQKRKILEGKLAGMKKQYFSLSVDKEIYAQGGRKEEYSYTIKKLELIETGIGIVEKELAKLKK